MKPLTMKIPDGSQSPPWLQKIHFVINPVDYLESTSRRFGTIFNAPVSGHYNPLLLVSEPQALKQILTNDTNQFVSAGSGYIRGLIGKEAVAALEGEKHKRRRRESESRRKRESETAAEQQGQRQRKERWSKNSLCIGSLGRHQAGFYDLEGCFAKFSAFVAVETDFQ